MTHDLKPLIYEVTAIDGEIQVTIIEETDDYGSEVYQQRLALTVHLIAAALEMFKLVPQN